MQSINDGKLSPDNVREIANRLDVKEAEVTDMENRLFSSDQSLNVQVADEANTEWQDLIADDAETQDIIVEKKDQYMHRKKLITKALKILNPREREIVGYRRLMDKPKKLEELSQKYKISRERVRQIEEKALEKLTKEISNTV